MKTRIGNGKNDQRLDYELLLNDETKEITDIKVVEDTEEINEIEKAQELRLINKDYSIPKVHIKTILIEAQKILQENKIHY